MSETVTRCQECSGSGEVERTMGGVCEPEFDATVVCSGCCGLGYQEASDMLKALVEVNRHRKLLPLHVQANLAHVLASMPYSSVRYAETSFGRVPVVVGEDEVKRTVRLIRDFHQMCVGLGQPGLGAELGIRVHRASRILEGK